MCQGELLWSLALNHSTNDAGSSSGSTLDHFGVAKMSSKEDKELNRLRQL